MPGKEASIAALELALEQTVLGMPMSDLFTADRAIVRKFANSRSDQPERRFASHVAKVVRSMADLVDHVHQLNLAPQPGAAVDASMGIPLPLRPGDEGFVEHRLAVIPDHVVIPTVAEPSPLLHLLSLYYMMTSLMSQALSSPFGVATQAWLTSQPFFILARLFLSIIIWAFKWGHVFISIWLSAFCLGFLLFMVTHPEWLLLGPLRLAKWVPAYANWALARTAEHAKAEVWSWFLTTGLEPQSALGHAWPGSPPPEKSMIQDAAGSSTNISIVLAQLALTTAEQQKSIISLQHSQWLWASLCAVGTTLGALLGSRINR